MSRRHWWVGFFPVKWKKKPQTPPTQTIPKQTGIAAPSFALNPPPVGFVPWTVAPHNITGLGLRKIYSTGVNPCCQAFRADSHQLLCLGFWRRTLLKCISIVIPAWSGPAPAGWAATEWNRSAASLLSVMQGMCSLLHKGWLLWLSSCVALRHLLSWAVQKPQAYTVP